MKIMCVKLDLKNSFKDEKDITEELLIKAKKQIKAKFANMGLDVTINDIIEPETFVKNYYKNEGYFVIKLEPNRYYSDYKIEEILKNKLTLEGFKYAIRDYASEKRLECHMADWVEAGVPDYFIFKLNGLIIEDAFYVEVKSNMCYLTYNQAKWIMNHANSLPVKTFWVVNDGELDGNKAD